MIIRISSLLILMLTTGFSTIFGFDIFSDPEIKIPYCAPGDDCGLNKWAELAWSWIEDVITEWKFSDVIQDVIVYFLGFITLIAVIYIIYAGFRILTSSGEEEVIKKAKSTIIYVIIGILVIWFAWTIANFAIGIWTWGN